jgi:hypothetical protein
MAAIGAARCSNCGAGLADNAKVCISCGTHIGSGLNVKTIQKAKTAGKFGQGMVIAGTTAVVGGALWAWLAVVCNVEIGYLAIGLGFINAIVLVAVTQETSFRVAIACCALAVLSLFVGKALTMHYLVDKQFTKHVMGDESLMHGLVANKMGTAREFSPEVQTIYDKWLEVDDDEIPEKVSAEVVPRYNRMSEAEREELAEPMVAVFLSQVGLGTRLGAVLGFYDILWVILAIGAAYKVGSGASA